MCISEIGFYPKIIHKRLWVTFLPIAQLLLHIRLTMVGYVVRLCNRNIGDDYTKNWSHHQIDMHLPMQHSGKKSIFRAINFREIKMKFLLKFIRLDYNPALISSKNYYLITFCWGENCFICGTEIGQTNNRLFKKKWIFFTLKTKQRV